MELSTMSLRFRVWDKEKRTFVPWDENCCFARDEDGYLYICNIDWGGKDLPEDGNNRFIISQDTGFKDKNGKSIYIGEFPVVYENGSIALKVRGENPFVGNYLILLCTQSSDSLEIVGNVFTN